MITHRFALEPAGDGDALRDSVGARPVLPAGTPWPVCECGRRMVLFLQLDLRPEFGLPFAPGSHLSVFMCPEHNDAPEIFDEPQLPAQFWERRRRIDGSLRFYELFLHKPRTAEHPHESDAILVPQRLLFARQDEQPDNEGAVLQEHPQHPGVSLSVRETVGGRQGLKVGGQPSWAQMPEIHRCCCGADMRFVCQVPVDWPFPKRLEAPPQPDSFSRDDYCLFLGNETYVFACERQCDARAVHVVVQN